MTMRDEPLSHELVLETVSSIHNLHQPTGSNPLTSVFTTPQVQVKKPVPFTKMSQLKSTRQELIKGLPKYETAMSLACAKEYAQLQDTLKTIEDMKLA
jgi:hypothetical protein